MIKLSSVIITLNEERNIGRCLDSLRGIADEIVVVDSGSTDRTEEICRTFGVRFFQHPFDGFTEQKNFAIDQCSFEHILSLDADESLSEELKKSVTAVKSNWNKDGYSFNRFTNYCGKWIKHCGWYPDRKLRLFRKEKGRWQGNKLHERFILNDTLTKLGEKCKKLILLTGITDSHLEIAKIMDFSSPEMARKEVFRCREKFRQFINEHPYLETVLKSIIRK